MSETPRTFSASGGSLTFGSTGRSRPRHSRLWWLVPVIIAGVLAVWFTRDTYEMKAFVARDAALRVTVSEAIARRAEWAESAIWNLVPGESELRSYHETLQEELPMPDWLAKNLFNTKLLIVYPEGAAAPTFVSRMTRTGTLVSRGLRWAPGIDIDRAGGLNIRALDDGSGYFAVRGRVLIASPSRRALITALTLSFDESAIAEGNMDPWNGTVRPGVYGVTALDTELRKQFGMERVFFGVDVLRERVRIALRGDAADTDAGIPALLAGAGGKLDASYPSSAAIALNLGRDLQDSTIAIAELFGVGEDTKTIWDQWKESEEEGTRVIAAALAGLGPELQMSLHGADPYEALPVPEIVIASTSRDKQIETQLRTLPEPSVGPGIETVHASYDPENRYLRIPMPGGESLEPSSAWHGDRYLFSTSKRRLDALLSGSEPAGSVPEEYAVYVRVKPADVMDVCIAIGRELASSHLLEGYSSLDAFESDAQSWRRRAASVSRIEAGLRDDDGAPVLECRIDLAPNRTGR